MPVHHPFRSSTRTWPVRPAPGRHPLLWRLRRRFHRPAPYWLLALGLAALTAVLVTRMVGHAEAEAARYGSLRATLVALTDLPAGATVGSGDTELRPIPAGLVPPGALDDHVDGAVVSSGIHTGEVVLGTRLSPAGLSPTAALLPRGTRGLAVPAGPETVPLARGDLVDVLATFDPTLAAGGGEPTVAVARAALVVDVGEDAVTIAVTEPRAPRVAFALATGSVTLALGSALSAGS